MHTLLILNLIMLFIINSLSSTHRLHNFKIIGIFYHLSIPLATILCTYKNTQKTIDLLVASTCMITIDQIEKEQ